jgi:hypothetical protein
MYCRFLFRHLRKQYERPLSRYSRKIFDVLISYVPFFTSLIVIREPCRPNVIMSDDTSIQIDWTFHANDIQNKITPFNQILHITHLVNETVKMGRLCILSTQQGAVN